MDLIGQKNKIMTTTLTDWKLDICKDIDKRDLPNWLKTNCFKMIVNLPDDHEDWKDYHYEFFIKAICAGVSKKKRKHLR